MKAGSVIGGLAGTAAMTAFSYAVSKEKRENFKEPSILGEMIYKAVPQLGEKRARIAGWILHLAAGTIISNIYKKMLLGSKPTFLKGALFGATGSIPAIFLYNMLFEIHPNPPKDVDRKKYSGHLLLAHIVFGGISFLIYGAKKKLTGNA